MVRVGGRDPCALLCTETSSAFRSRVSVVDAVTGESAATGSTINLRSAAFQDSVVLTKDSPYVQWEDSARAGVYDIMVRKLGYHDWSQSGVRIEGGRCHVPSPTRVIALLQPQ